MKIPILVFFFCLNGERSFTNWRASQYCSIMTTSGAKPSNCIKRGMCEKACSRHLKIRDLLCEVESTFSGKLCPMERAVMYANAPDDALIKIRKTLKELIDKAKGDRNS